jgi:hypothetical protein
VTNSRNAQALENSIQKAWPGMTTYDIGDLPHASGTSDHNPDDTVIYAGGKAEQSDSDSIPEVRAVDAMIGPKFTPADAKRLFETLSRDPSCQARMSYVIYNRRIRSRKDGWVDRAYNGSDPHTNHVHGSTWAGADSNSAPFTAVEALSTEEGTLTMADIQDILEAIAKVQKSADAAALRANGLLMMDDVTTSWSTTNPKGIQTNELRIAVESLEGMVAPVAAPDPAVLKAAVETAVAAALPSALESALQDGTMLAKFAKAVADEESRRMAS